MLRSKARAADGAKEAGFNTPRNWSTGTIGINRPRSFYALVHAGRRATARRIALNGETEDVRAGTTTDLVSHRAFLVISALVFAAGAAVTIVGCSSMSAMGGMPMPGGWTMSMAWMRMPGKTWPGAAASFLGMWIVMMVPMMLPSLVPTLLRYRELVGMSGKTHLGRLTAFVGAGYFSVWIAIGLALFPVGLSVATVEMRLPQMARAAPFAVGMIVLAAGAFQLTRWKAQQLACCRNAPEPGRMVPADAGSAWRLGIRLGARCSLCCATLMTILVVVGVMDLRAMAVVTAGVTAERLAPFGERVAKVIGAICLGAGSVLIAQAAGVVPHTA